MSRKGEMKMLEVMILNFITASCDKYVAKGKERREKLCIEKDGSQLDI